MTSTVRRKRNECVIFPERERVVSVKDKERFHYKKIFELG